MLWRAFTTPPTYTAELTFMVNEDEGGGGFGGVSAILGQFGFGGVKSGSFNLEKMLQLAKSRRIVEQAIFEETKINGKLDYIANHIINIYEFHEKWEDDTTGLVNFVFVKDSIPIFNRTENTALKEIHIKIVGNEDTEALMSSSINEDTGILAMRSTTENEDLSIALTNNIYNKLSNFYINKSIERQETTYLIIKNKTDSLQNALNAAQSRLLRFQDANRGLTLLRYEAEKIRLQQEVQKLILAYGESYKQLEVADFSLRNSTPVVQVIDMPVGPIEEESVSVIIKLLVGILAGGILSSIYIVGEKILKEAVIDDENSK